MRIVKLTALLKEGDVVAKARMATEELYKLVKSRTLPALGQKVSI